ncbi:CAP domain-containing protein [Streptomyces sp. MBT42]|uniref:CAP domain-containing protein n=1 Tax=Streptomyces sp. MBT42 TaxID=1488373 RepID=UPI001E4E7BDC|nr:CAP domain-containing protein [Streptomyces sp. MBT42]MCD2462764.1 CAP domain-containing protein [Streptomyces sp. MBT42]
MRQSTGIERDTELVLAARNGDPWARDQLITAHLPLTHTTVALAMNGRHGAEHVEHVVRETMLRALDGLPTLTDPGVFRPWLVAIAVDGIRRHRHQQPAGYGGEAAPPAAHGQAYEITEAARWLDPEDGEQLALWWLECAGELTRYETAAALRWPAEEAPARIEAVRARLDAARVVVGALAGNPGCPFLGREAAEWDGRPSAPWRDHLAHHTIGCGHCAPRWHALVPAEVLLAANSPVLAARTDEAARETTTRAAAFAAAADGPGTAPAAYAAAVGDPYGTTEDTSLSATAPLGGYGPEHAADLTEPYVLAGQPAHTRPHVPRSAPASSAPGRHGTRAALRRRRQTQERSRRRAVIAAGVVVMAVTGGAFSLSGGRGGDDEILGANRVTAPELELPLDQDPSTHSGTPSAAATTPSTSPSASKSATGRPPASASPSAKPTTASPRPVRTTEPAPVRTTPPRTEAPTPDTPPTRPGSGNGGGSGDEAGNGTGAGPQHDNGQSSEADQVIALVNAERAKAGCGPLSANATLTRAAQGHSEDMAARDFFDHTNPDGAGPGERVTAAGYPWSTYGENIAMGQSSPEQVMESWMNSPGHRANILNCDFKEIGVGIHSQGGPYWTQVFGAR